MQNHVCSKYLHFGLRYAYMLQTWVHARAYVQRHAGYQPHVWFWFDFGRSEGGVWPVGPQQSRGQVKNPAKPKKNCEISFATNTISKTQSVSHQNHWSACIFLQFAMKWEGRSDIKVKDCTQALSLGFQCSSRGVRAKCFLPFGISSQSAWSCGCFFGSPGCCSDIGRLDAPTNLYLACVYALHLVQRMKRLQALEGRVSIVTLYRIDFSLKFKGDGEP